MNRGLSPCGNKVEEILPSEAGQMPFVITTFDPMFPIIEHRFGDSTFYLSSEKVMFWKEQKSLIVADIHLGKTGHFRKAGIGVPARASKEDLHRLFKMISFFRAEQLIVVGDMFHSRHNKELDLFKKWRADCSNLTIELIKGNHDILSEQWCSDARINTYETKTYENQFLFVHDCSGIDTLPESNLLIFSGHVHPAIHLKGGGRQSLRFPCYHFKKGHALLPAFSHFSGNMIIRPDKDDEVFAVVDKFLVKIGI